MNGHYLRKSPLRSNSHPEIKRLHPSVISELLEDIGAAKSATDNAKAGAEAAYLAAQEAKPEAAKSEDIADGGKAAADEAKSRVAEVGAGIIDSEWIEKNVRCIKCEVKIAKLREVCAVVSSVDPSILQELRDEITPTKSKTDEAKATMDEATDDSADAKDAASDGQRDATSAGDAVSDAKNAVHSMKS